LTISDVSSEEYEANKRLLDLLNSKRTIFYEILEKKFSKILTIFNNTIREFNLRNIVNLVAYNCLFSEFIKANFSLEYSKYLNLQTKNIVLNNLKFQIIQSIKKVGILLGGDNWKRIALQDDHE
jgi:hypothetical protein